MNIRIKIKGRNRKHLATVHSVDNTIPRIGESILIHYEEKEAVYARVIDVLYEYRDITGQTYALHSHILEEIVVTVDHGDDEIEEGVL